MSISNDELQMLRDAAERVVREATAGGIGSGRDMDEAAWSAAVESGWTALAVPEAAGGLGAGAAELCVLAEELGRGLLVGRFLLGSVLASQWLAAAPAGARRDRQLEALLGGSCALAIADAEPAARGAPGVVSLQARALAQRGGWRLEGGKLGVWSEARTDSLLVSALDVASGETLLFDVSLDARGLLRRDYATVDGGRALDLEFAGVELDEQALLAGPGSGFGTARRRAWDLVLLAESAECIGLMKALLQRTAEYLASRKQFGQPLARLQVLRHRLADMALARFRAEALVGFAVPRLATLDDAARQRLVAATLSKSLQGARFVAEQAVQLHGGMGVSEELPIGRFLRRMLALEATLGTPDFHRGRFEDVATP
jgi:alkylation response protein AidB-like acyl-CoA dehydrogenase